MNLTFEYIDKRFQKLENLIESRISTEFLTIKESAAYFRVSVSGLRDLLYKGKIPFYRINESDRSTILLKRKDLKKYLEKKRQNIH